MSSFYGCPYYRGVPLCWSLLRRAPDVCGCESMYMCVCMCVCMMYRSTSCTIICPSSLQKRDDRLATLAKTSSVKDENKEKWKDVLTLDFMSSEESAVEENLDGSQRHVLYVSDLWWRAKSVASFFHRLDEKCSKKKSKKSEMQTRHKSIKGCQTVANPKRFLEITGPSKSNVYS